MSFFRSPVSSDRPALKIAPHDPLREWRIHLYWFLTTSVLIVVILVYARLVTAPGFSDLRVERNEARTEARQALRKLSETNARRAIAERRVQVADEAGRALEKTLVERLAREARLKADLNFYERMLGGEQKNQGLSAFSLSLKASGAPGVYRFTLTLAQNLRDAQVISGLTSMRLDGALDGALKSLEWAELTRGTGGAALPFSFKYFARLEGQIIVPEGFQPATFTVRMDPEEGTAITNQIAWNQALTTED